MRWRVISCAGKLPRRSEREERHALQMNNRSNHGTIDGCDLDTRLPQWADDSCMTN